MELFWKLLSRYLSGVAPKLPPDKIVFHFRNVCHDQTKISNFLVPVYSGSRYSNIQSPPSTSNPIVSLCIIPTIPPKAQIHISLPRNSPQNPPPRAMSAFPNTSNKCDIFTCPLSRRELDISALFIRVEGSDLDKLERCHAVLLRPGSPTPSCRLNVTSPGLVFHDHGSIRASDVNAFLTLCLQHPMPAQPAVHPSLHLQWLAGLLPTLAIQLPGGLSPAFLP